MISKSTVDNFITKNYDKLKNMAYNTSIKMGNDMYVEDLIGEFYLFLIERMKRNDTEKDLEAAMAYFFKCQYFKDSVVKKLNQTDKPTKLLFVPLSVSYLDIYEKENEIAEEDHPINVQLNILQDKIDNLPPAYKELYNLIFIQKNITLKDLAKELNTTLFGANQSRRKLFELMEIKPKLHKLK